MFWHRRRQEHAERLRRVEARIGWLEDELAILKAKYVHNEITIPDLEYLTERVLLGETASTGSERAAHQQHL